MKSFYLAFLLFSILPVISSCEKNEGGWHYGDIFYLSKDHGAIDLHRQTIEYPDNTDSWTLMIQSRGEKDLTCSVVKGPFEISVQNDRKVIYAPYYTQSIKLSLTDHLWKGKGRIQIIAPYQNGDFAEFNLIR